jgi:hypothetical protein
VKGTAAGQELYEDVSMMMQCLNVPIWIPVEAVTDDAPSIPGTKSGVSLHSYVKNKIVHNLIIFLCLTHQETVPSLSKYVKE